MNEDFFQKLNQIIDDNAKMLNSAYSKLKGIEDSLRKINDMTGATKRAETCRKEISEMGWQNIVSKYHPDINCDDPAANELFAFYKYIYENMKNQDEVA